MILEHVNADFTILKVQQKVEYQNYKVKSHKGAMQHSSVSLEDCDILAKALKISSASSLFTCSLSLWFAESILT